MMLFVKFETFKKSLILYIKKVKANIYQDFPMLMVELEFPLKPGKIT